MKTCDNCEERYDERDGAFGLCESCWQSSRQNDDDTEGSGHAE
jgi:hypothetical protein